MHVVGVPLQPHCSIWASNVGIQVGERNRSTEGRNLDRDFEKERCVFCML